MDPQWSWATNIYKGRPIWFHTCAFRWSNRKRQRTIRTTGHSSPGTPRDDHSPSRMLQSGDKSCRVSCLWCCSLQYLCCLLHIMDQVFFVQDWLHPGWRVVLQKEPRSRRVLDSQDEQILGISGDLSGMQLPMDMNAYEFRPNLMHAAEAVPAAEMTRLNALVRGENNQDGQHARVRVHLGRERGRGARRRRLPRRNMN